MYVCMYVSFFNKTSAPSLTHLYLYLLSQALKFKMYMQQPSKRSMYVCMMIQFFQLSLSGSFVGLR